MGYSMSWVGVRGIDRIAAYDRLGLVPTGQSGDRNDYVTCGRAGPNGWTLVILGRVGHRLVKAHALQRFSSGCSILACNVEEHVMFSSAELWENGTQVWQTTHDSDRSGDHLDNSGTLPAEFAGIEREIQRLQAAEDPADEFGVDHFFDIPLVLARGITSFKHDEAGLDEFERLEWKSAAEPPTARPWWRFGRK
jgi:hypothetical protein